MTALSFASPEEANLLVLSSWEGEGTAGASFRWHSHGAGLEIMNPRAVGQVWG